MFEDNPVLESLWRGGHAPAAMLERLAAVQRPAAALLLPQLAPSNPLLYATSASGGYGGGSSGGGAADAPGQPKAGSLLAYVMAEKAKHGDKVLLVRVGDFFEAFGLDAVMLVEVRASFSCHQRGKAHAVLFPFSFFSILIRLTRA